MELKQNPFSLYDFLGYFTPGAIFIYGCIAIYAHSNFMNIEDIINFDKQYVYIPFILASYTSGHLLSFVSSIFIEKYSIWVVGYPSKYLLDYQQKNYFFTNRFVRFAVAAFLAPVSITELILNVTLKYRATYTQPLDGLLIVIIKAKMDALLTTESGLLAMPKNTSASSTDFFRFAYHYAVESAPNHYPKMQNYVAIYGFLRTMTLISVLFFWGIVCHLFTYGLEVLQTSYVLFGVALLSFIFYMAFVKFWRRFTLEALMAVATTFKVDTKVDPEMFSKAEGNDAAGIKKS